MSVSKARLSEVEWAEIFRLRCKGKRGDRLHPDEQKMVERAYKENPERYSGMENDVVRATLPFGAIDPTRGRP